jgi:hypothetical protein
MHVIVHATNPAARDPPPAMIAANIVEAAKANSTFERCDVQFVPARYARAPPARERCGNSSILSDAHEFPVPNPATIFLNFGGHFAAPVVMASDYSLPQN